jgi:DNA-binding NtrC family response regulator
MIRPGPDCEMLEETFREAGWDLVVAGTLPSALAEQRSRPFPLVLCEREWTGCDWHKAVAVLSSMPPRPWLILMSGRCDKNLWDELTWLGGSDILRTPLGRDSVIRAIRSGWLLWQHMRELRRVTRSGA